MLLPDPKPHVSQPKTVRHPIQKQTTPLQTYISELSPKLSASLLKAFHKSRRLFVDWGKKCQIGLGVDSRRLLLRKHPSKELSYTFKVYLYQTLDFLYFVFEFLSK